jgi:hypothetical protein
MWICDDDSPWRYRRLELGGCGDSSGGSGHSGVLGSSLRLWAPRRRRLRVVHFEADPPSHVLHLVRLVIFKITTTPTAHLSKNPAEICTYGFTDGDFDVHELTYCLHLDCAWHPLFSSSEFCNTGIWGLLCSN